MQPETVVMPAAVALAAGAALGEAGDAGAALLFGVEDGVAEVAGC